MHPPPQFICWNPIFNVGVLEGCALGRWLDLDCGALKNGISTLIREDSHLWNRKQAFLRNPLCWCLDLGLPCLENCEWYVSIVNKPCSLWCFVIRNSNWDRTQWASGPGHLVFFKLCSHPDSPRTKLVVKSLVLLKLLNSLCYTKFFSKVCAVNKLFVGVFGQKKAKEKDLCFLPG